MFPSLRTDLVARGMEHNYLSYLAFRTATAFGSDVETWFDQESKLIAHDSAGRVRTGAGQERMARPEITEMRAASSARRHATTGHLPQARDERHPDERAGADRNAAASKKL
jgi:hypothetical protein